MILPYTLLTSPFALAPPFMPLPKLLISAHIASFFSTIRAIIRTFATVLA
jgi:hypothetical protein